MDYFRNILGTPQGGTAPTGAETIEKLCDRVQSSTLLEDRRDAVRAIKSLSRKFHLEVGTQAMGILVHVLDTDRTDAEILGYALETLCNVMSNEPLDDEEELTVQIPEDLGIQFTEMFISKPENVGILLSLLEEYDFHVRWPTVKLLTILLSNKSRDLQEAILVSPMGVSKLMDLLSDSREIIRNDGLLLLIQLTKGNANIQKIVAFEGAFERLLDIITEEGMSDGGIVVEDCLLLLLNLMKNNSSNQNFFKEGSYIQRMPPYFELQPADQSPQGGWSAQKVTNIHLMLQLIRTLVSPSNPNQQVASCQRVMNQCGLLQQLCSILMASGVPADVLTETINTVSEVIRGNTGNQEYFASVMAPSNPPRPAIVVLLMSMVNDKQPFVLRCAVLYCFESFLFRNDLGQSQIVQTLLPQSADANSISAGQLLCSGLFSIDSLSTWFAAVALLHAIVGNAEQKEQLLRVQLATSMGNPPVSLLQQCSNILAQGGKLQTRVGLLMLLCHWCAQCPIAVTHFLLNESNVPFLISQVSASEGDEQEILIQGLCAFLLGICVEFNTDQVENYQRQHMRQIIEKRIGLEKFSDKLCQVSKHEGYIRAAKQPQMNYKHANEVLFDHEFTKLFKRLESEVLKCVLPVEEGESEDGNHTVDQHDNIVGQYKELIREQDSQLCQVKAELEAMQATYANTDRTIQELTQQIQQLKDQNALLKAQRGGNNAGSSSDVAVLTHLQQKVDEQNKKIAEQDALVESLKSELTNVNKNSPTFNNDDHSAAVKSSELTDQLEEYRKKIEQKDEEVKLYKSKLEDNIRQAMELNKKVPTDDEGGAKNSALLAEHNHLSERLSNQELCLRKLEEEKVTLQSTIDDMKKEMECLNKKIKDLEEEKHDIDEERHKSLEEMEESRKEQEDLLVLLSDQETKLKKYRKKLKELGYKFEDDEEDDDDEDEDDDEDDDDDDDDDDGEDKN